MRLPVPDVLLRTLSRQLGGPSGPLSPLVARMLNKGDGPEIAAAVGALDLTGSEEVADIGFGGGLGLDLLLDQTRDGGRVLCIEPSPDMLRHARKAHAAEVGAGRLAPLNRESSPFRDRLGRPGSAAVRLLTAVPSCSHLTGARPLHVSSRPQAPSCGRTLGWWPSTR